MNKLTLRQFTDVVKALMEASLTKEYGIRLEIIEEPDEISDDGVKVTLKVEKESIKECTKSGKMCETYSCDCNSNAYFFDMDENYHDYEERMDKGEEPESDILRDITDKMLKSISKEMEENPEPAKEKNNEREESICSDDMDSGSCSEDDAEVDAEETAFVCKCIMKAALVCAAIPIGIFVAKRYFSDKK